MKKVLVWFVLLINVSILKSTAIEEKDSVVIHNYLVQSQLAFKEKDYNLSQTIAKNALNQSIKHNYIRGKANALFMVAKGMHWVEEFDSAKVYYDEALRLFIILNDKRFLADVYSKKGQLLKQTANIALALENYNQALLIYRDKELLNITDSVFLNSKSDLFIDYGIANKRIGNFDLAIEYYLNSIEIKHQINDINGIAICYGNIGNIYSDLALHSKAVKFYKLSNDYFHDLKNDYLLEKVNTALAREYIRIENLDSADYFLLKSLEFNETTKNTRNRIFTINLLAEREIKSGNINKALIYYFSNKEYLGESSVKDLVPDVYYKISRTYLLKNDLDSAKFWLERGVSTSNRIGYISLRLEGLKNLANYYTFIKDYKKAYQYLQDYYNLSDSTSNSTVLNSIFSKQNEFQLDQNRSTIRELELRIESMNENKRKGRKVLISIIVIAFLEFFLAVILIIQLKRKMNAINELSNQVTILKKSRPYISKNKLSVRIT